MQNTEGFQGRENSLYDALMVDTSHYTFVQTYGMYNIKGKY